MLIFDLDGTLVDSRADIAAATNRMRAMHGLEALPLEEVEEMFARAFEKVQSEFREVRKLAPGKRHVKLVAAPASVFELGWKTRHM